MEKVITVAVQMKTTHALQEAFSHVLWIGGATDSGKSTAAKILVDHHQLQLYSYDRRDIAHHELLASTHPEYAAFMSASLDER